MGESLFLAREIGLDARLAFCEAKRKLPVKGDWRFAKQSANLLRVEFLDLIADIRI